MGVTKRTVEWQVYDDNDDDPITIRPHVDTLEFRWGCQSFDFDLADVPVLVTCINALKPHPDVWLKLPNHEAYVRLDSGRMEAGTRLAVPDREIEWKPLRKALREVVEAEA